MDLMDIFYQIIILKLLIACFPTYQVVLQTK